jgi:hypothetical protein
VSGATAIDDYPGMQIEYDRMPTGSVVVGCIVVKKK